MYKTNLKAVVNLCLILFAYETHPEYRLVVAANRDESYARPTAPACFWEDAPKILAGRDLEKMGTWMGITTGGKFAALTNYRHPNEWNLAGKLSRGELVADFLKGEEDPETYLSVAAQKGEKYPGFNLLAGDGKSLYYFSNREGIVRKVPPGIHGVSNHLLNTAWPKVERGKKGLAELMGKDKETLRNGLFSLLEHADPAPDEELPDTGVGLALERMLSPLFIKSEGYGTRSSAVLLMGERAMTYTERIYNGTSFTEQEFIIPVKVL